jgi:hypothetical protein
MEVHLNSEQYTACLEREKPLRFKVSEPDWISKSSAIRLTIDFKTWG